MVKITILLRVSEANEVPISSHVWVGLSTFNWLYNLYKKSEKCEVKMYGHFMTS